jgi:hypothetical protein
MDVESQAKFDEIVKKDPAALTPGEIDILRARRSYLTEEQTLTFASVLDTAGASGEGEQSTEPKPDTFGSEFPGGVPPVEGQG